MKSSENEKELYVDEKRQADRIISAFFYQIWQTIYYWINLEENEELYIEKAEDFDVFKGENLETVQVKDTPTKSVSLNDKSVINSIYNLWNHQKQNPKLNIKLAYLTRSKRAKERQSNFSDIKGLDFWDNLKESENPEGAHLIKDHLIEHKHTPKVLASYLKGLSENQFKKKIIDQVNWLSGRKKVGILKNKIENQLITFGDKKRGYRSATSQKVLPHLLRKVEETIDSEDSRILTKADFIECFDKATDINIPKRNFRVLSNLATIPLKKYLRETKKLSQEEAKRYAEALVFSSTEKDIEEYFDDIPLLEALSSGNFNPESFLSETQQKPESNKSNPILTYEERQILGIICTSQISIWTAERLDNLFFQLNWIPNIESLEEKGLIFEENSILKVEENAKEIILSNTAEVEKFHGFWIEELEKLQKYYDASFLLALHHLSLDNIKRAITIIADNALSLSPGFWSDIHSKVLKEFYKSNSLDKYELGLQIKILNALAVCSSRSNNNKEAKEYILKALRLSETAQNSWGLGNSLINAGVICNYLGEDEQSIEYYTKAKRHAENNDDNILLGRSLNNLAMHYLDSNPPKAKKFLDRALQIKKESNDIPGIAGSFLGIGNYYSANHDYQESIQWYQKAKEIAKENHLLYIEALSYINIGGSHLNLDDNEDGLEYYLKALKISKQESISNSLVLALRGIANSYGKLGQYDMSLDYLEELLEHQKELSFSSNELLQTKFDIGVAHFKKGDLPKGRDVIIECLNQAKELKDGNLIFESRKTIALTYRNEEKELTYIKLEDFANQELKEKNYLVSVKLFKELAQLLILDEAKNLKKIEKLFRKVIDICSKNNLENELIETYGVFYNWKFSDEKFEEALTILQEYEEKLPETQSNELAAIWDEMGICLQNLSKFDEALEFHEKSLAKAEELGNQRLIHNASNNLGEAYRKVGKYEQSLIHLDKAIKIAKSRSDNYDKYQSLHNKAITLTRKTDYNKAEKLLLRLRKQTEKHKYFDIYIKSLYGLASISFEKKAHELSSKRYGRAYAEAIQKEEIEYLSNIAINYSEVLLKLKQNDKAISVLKETTSKIDKILHHYYLYRALYRAHKPLDDIESEISYLKLSLEAARKLNATPKIVDTLVELADIHKKNSNFIEADKYFSQASKLENQPKWKAAILIDRLKLLLEKNKDEEAELLFEEIKSYAHDNSLQSTLVDIHMIVGDYQWFSGEKDNKTEALKAYLAALIESIGDDFKPDIFTNIGIHIYHNLYDLYEDKGENAVQNLKREIINWLEEEIKDQSTIKKIIWPISLSEKVIKEVESGDGVQEELINDIVESELQFLFGS